MLSRVAESLTWMSRYIERAESLARALDVVLNRTVDRNAAGRERAHHLWREVLDRAGLDPAGDDGEAALARAVFSLESGSTIVGCVRSARSNAVGVRAELPTEVWETVNGLYLYVEAQSPLTLQREGPSAFLRRVRDAAQGFGGVVDATLTHDEEWDFIQVGRYLERAQTVARAVRGYDASDDSPSEAQRVLESCCASEPFAKFRRWTGASEEVIAFLLFNRASPRSVRYCVHEVDAALHRISGSAGGSVHTEAERWTGRTTAWLDYAQPHEVIEEGARVFAGRLVDRLETIGRAIESAYFPRVAVAS